MFEGNVFLEVQLMDIMMCFCHQLFPTSLLPNKSVSDWVQLLQQIIPGLFIDPSYFNNNSRSASIKCFVFAAWSVRPTTSPAFSPAWRDDDICSMIVCFTTVQLPRVCFPSFMFAFHLSLFLRISLFKFPSWLGWGTSPRLVSHISAPSSGSSFITRGSGFF